MRSVFVLFALGLIAAAAARADSGPIRATMTTSSKEAIVDAPWRYTIVVENADGRPVAAKARLQIARGNVVVGCWKRTAMVACSGADAGTWIAFDGTHAGVLRWAAQWAGAKRTFQATVIAGTRSLRLRAPLTVRLATRRATR